MKLLTALGNYTDAFHRAWESSTRVCERALTIAERLGDVDYQLRALLALWNGCFASGEVVKSKEIALRFHEVALASSDAADALLADRLYGTSVFATGHTQEARVHLERMVFGDAKQPRDSNLVRFQVDQLAAGRAILTLCLLHLGLLDQARTMAEDCLDEVIRLNNAMTLGGIVATTCTVTALRIGDAAALDRYVSILEEHSGKFGLTPWLEIAQAFGAVAQIRKGNSPDGLRTLNRIVDETIDKGNRRYALIFANMPWRWGAPALPNSVGR